MSSSTLAVKVTPDLAAVIAAARIVARHLTAMADELEALPGDEKGEQPSG